MIVVILIGTTVSSALVNGKYDSSSYAQTRYSDANYMQGYMSYHYLILWDRHRRVAITIVAVFFMTYIPATALALKSAVDYHSKSSASSLSPY